MFVRTYSLPRFCVSNSRDGLVRYQRSEKWSMGSQTVLMRRRGCQAATRRTWGRGLCLGDESSSRRMEIVHFEFPTSKSICGAFGDALVETTLYHLEYVMVHLWASRCTLLDCSGLRFLAEGAACCLSTVLGGP